uniref:Uncharacterized protein n=1 Tax=Ditylenchus dipsaci TaxID=166011 RepID=A0A915CQB0_9BILA
MSSLDEQLALFEKEMRSATEEPSNGQTSIGGAPQKYETNPNAALRAGMKMSFSGPVLPSVSVAPKLGMTDIGSAQAGPSTFTKFVPHQLRAPSHPIANFIRGTPQIPVVPSQPVTIESGPTLYNTSTKANKKDESTVKRKEELPPLPRQVLLRQWLYLQT